MISVIVPVYNVYSFLGECVESICNQTFADLEILLVDDGSTDQSGVLCDKYAEKDDRIRVIHQQNQGLSGARNTGVKHANAEFIVFVDSDDRIHSEMIQALYKAMQQNDADISICSHKIIQENEPKEQTGISIENLENIEILTGRECVKRMYSAQPIDMVVAWNKLYKKEIFSQLQYPVGRLHEDEFLTYKILYPLAKCVYVKAPLYEYRMRKNSIVSNKSFRRLKDKMDAYKERYIYFEHNDDRELYCEALRRYETSIAELILYLEENHLERDLIRKLNSEFKSVYRTKIVTSEMDIQHKWKYRLFMVSPSIYKILKEADKNKGNKN